MPGIGKRTPGQACAAVSPPRRPLPAGAPDAGGPAGEQVVCDVIVDECRCPGAPAADRRATSGRLAVSAYPRCRQLAGLELTYSAHNGFCATGNSVRQEMRLTGIERGARGLVLFGDLGYLQASREAGISTMRMAVLLRTVLLGPEAWVDGGAAEGGLPRARLSRGAPRSGRAWRATRLRRCAPAGRAVGGGGSRTRG
jgi:hypothetical protein